MGHWKNFEELEENLSMAELQAVLDASRDKQYENWKFQASLKGINLDSHSDKSNSERLEEIKMRAIAKQQGKTEQDIHLNVVGFGVEEETESE